MINWFIQNWDKLSTVFFAGLSAVFAGLSFLVLFLDYRRDNPRVRISVNRSYVALPRDTLEAVSCSLVNTGRRVLTIYKFNFLMSNGEYLHFLPNSPAFLPDFPELPVALDETNKFSFTLLLDALKEAKLSNGLGIRAVCFEDTAGNQYKSYFKKKYWKEIY